MRSTPESKQAAYDAGYAYYVSGKRTRADALAFDTRNMIPAEAWSWVRGWEAAQAADRAGTLA